MLDLIRNDLGRHLSQIETEELDGYDEHTDEYDDLIAALLWLKQGEGKMNEQRGRRNLAAGTMPESINDALCAPRA